MQRTRLGIFTCALLFFLLQSFSSVAQMSQDQFGKNRIQYKKFEWKLVSTENFDIYYYFEGESLAPIAATHVESVFRKLESTLGYSGYNKTKVLIYNSTADLQQSNIGLQYNSSVGGTTNLVKPTVEVAFKGDLTEFKEDLTEGIARTWIKVILFGGNFKEVVQSSYFLSLPDWYIKGASAFIAKGWNREMDNYMRDLVESKKLRNPSYYSGDEATLIGQSVWQFISDRYGPDMFTNILQITRIYRSDRASIEAATGNYFKNFIDDWKAYYSEKALELGDALVFNENYKAINGHNHKAREITTPVLSKDGRYLAYSTNYKGRFNMFLKDLETGKKKKIYSGGFKINDQTPIIRNPKLAWQSESTLAAVIYKKGKIIYKTFDLKNKELEIQNNGKHATSSIKNKKERRKIEVFHQINSYSFSDDGKFIAFSADEKGQADIWLYDIDRAKYLKITNDEYDDHSPKFGAGNSVIFSSNRNDDTLYTYTRYQSAPNYSLFIYKPGSKSLQRISAQGCNYTQPMFLDASTILYLNDNNGVQNLYKQDIKTGKAAPLTNNLTDILEYDYNVKEQRLVFSARSKGKEKVFVDTAFSVLQTVEITAKTEQSDVTRKRILPPEKPKQTNNFIKVTPKQNEDDIDLDKVYFESDSTLKLPKKVVPVVVDSKSPPKRTVISTSSPYDYKNLFGTDNVLSGINVDPLRGVGLLVESKMSDLMGNHRINLGFFGIADLKSSSMWGEYMYLKKRIDMGVRFDRSTYFPTDGTNRHRYAINTFETKFSLPLTVYSRISASPFLTTTRFSDVSDFTTVVNYQDQKRLYVGSKFELVYDNTISSGMNMLQGTRAKITFDKYINTTNENGNFSRFNLDIRRYQKIHRSVILAMRGSFGTSFGPSAKSYVFGGMDNWLFNSTGTGGVKNPLEIRSGVDNTDIMLTKYVTNVRGFKYNAQSGNSYFLVNLEVRLPIVKYFYSGSISSAFLRNLQLVTFTDIGAAWYGANPFTTDNSLNKTIIPGSSFQAEVNNYRNPFLYGYGFGARTFLFGYYVKADVAWGIKDNIVQTPLFYLTLGYDF
jgi:Tol biopolymer transport system component